MREHQREQNRLDFRLNEEGNNRARQQYRKEIDNADKECLRFELHKLSLSRDAQITLITRVTMSTNMLTRVSPFVCFFTTSLGNSNNPSGVAPWHPLSIEWCFHLPL